MLEWIWGFVLFLAVASAAFSVVMWISTALFGKTVTAILLALFTLWAIWCGWVWLIHSDRLGVQVLGWAIAALVVCTVAGLVRAGVRKVRAA
jgi:hypothetical protein